ncbi:histidine kinase [Paenibacillus sp. GCM10023252]|uniref:histidine kinase n=1 Tax=Paenibacillus sp. GCM10023252 TaxID=3252649 RepID=UPI0036134B5D
MDIPYRRKSPEEILLTISKLHLGKLKVLIGAVSGSGKTYHMLQEGQQLKQQGIDVVLCAVTTLQRPETVRQASELERVPIIHWMKDGAEQKDLNLEALLLRDPEVVLVDGLAHRNRPGAQHATRLEDIRFLMARGISIITTINVYELEGADEMAQRLTGIHADQTVPADTLELADEVRLIDVSPETMLKRLEEGVLGSEMNPALSRRGNLGVLREIALRLVAEGVNDSLEKLREEQGLSGPAGVAERILVSAQYHWNGSLYVRRGQQIARRLNGDIVVLTFVHPKKPLSREQLTFKRSIVKLTQKVGAEFAEVPLARRRAIPSLLAKYAAEEQITRVVMGHSKQSWLQQLRQGSIVDSLLHKLHGVDLFLMADRAEHEGERILPVMQRELNEPGQFRRLSSEELAEKVDTLRRGTFKVYIGASPGVGKTYTMLREGNVLLRKGVDVVIGLLETHGRKETAEQVGSLPLIARKQIDYMGTKLEEMDTDAILARNPDVVLVDELAHTNVPTSDRRKRYEDVIRILESGISVISTINVQHLESLNDAVEQLTGVRVRETVPDAILKLADEVELIDVTPQMLQERMRDGKIYAMDKVEQALGAFFTTGNLIALRELALREIADDVDERLEAWDRNHSLRGPLRRREVIYVAVALQSDGDRLIRRGFRIAHRLKADWHVCYVHYGGQLTDQEKVSLAALTSLTERLGGIFECRDANNRKGMHRALLAGANAVKATQLIIGHSRRSLWYTLLKGDLTRKLLRSGRHMDVLVVADRVLNKQ